MRANLLLCEEVYIEVLTPNMKKELTRKRSRGIAYGRETSPASYNIFIVFNTYIINL